jgi:hypothetical protein
MNTRLRKRAVGYLKWVLSELNRLCYDPETQVREVQSSILFKSVIILYHVRRWTIIRSASLDRSAEAYQSQETKAHLYVGEIHAMLEQKLIMRPVQVQSVLQDLDRRLQLVQNHERFCQSIYSLQHSVEFRDLFRRLGAHSVAQASLFKVRHYVGRLGSWTPASQALVRVVTAAPHLLRNFRVRTVRTPSALPNPFTGRDISLRESINRVIPSSSDYRALELVQALSNVELNLQEAFVNRCKHHRYSTPHSSRLAT